VTKGKKANKPSIEHEVWANSWEEAADIMMNRHRDVYKMHPSEFVYPNSMQYLGKEKKQAPPPPKPPNVGSKEYEARQEMQRRVDEQKGYKGD
jgi:hypothetical protein